MEHLWKSIGGIGIIIENKGVKLQNELFARFPQESFGNILGEKYGEISERIHK